MALKLFILEFHNRRTGDNVTFEIKAVNITVAEATVRSAYFKAPFDWVMMGSAQRGGHAKAA